MTVNDSTPLDKREYVLVSRFGDFVKAVVSTGLEAVKVNFTFTPNEEDAKRFSYNDLFSPLATVSVGGEFIRGYIGQMRRVK